MTERARKLFAGLFGAFLGLTLVKFGNPVILDHLIEAPGQGWELIFNAWPSRWVFNTLHGPNLFLSALFLLAVAWLFHSTLSATLRHISQSNTAKLVLACGLGWYAWQWIASADTASRALTSVTLSQFTVCGMCFLIGLFCLSQVEQLSWFWWGLLVGFCLVLWAAMDQRFGGLEATRQMIYERGDLDRYPEEFLKRISTGRVFGTLCYPNALAGAILLIAPAALTFTFRITAHRANIMRGLCVGLLGYLALGSLYWSGSKSGWLIAAGMVLVLILRLPLTTRKRWGIVGLIGVLSLGAFVWRFADYFQRGATSVVARFDYWEAAWANALENPVTGSGPGTFQIPYAKMKRPESEMARLVHNDYLQQATDSGFPGCLLYCGLVIGATGLLYRRSCADQTRFAVWLGVAAFALHSMVEFGLYIPAIAWPAAALLGWLLASSWTVEPPRAARK